MVVAGHKCTVAFLHVHVITFLVLQLVCISLPAIKCNDVSSGSSTSDNNLSASSSNEEVIRKELVKVQILQRLGLNDKPQVDLAHKISKDLVLEALKRTENFQEEATESTTASSSSSNVNHHGGGGRRNNKGRHSKSRAGADDKNGGDGGGNYAKTSEIIAFPDKGPELNGHNLLSFSYAGDQAYGVGVRVKKAHLWVKMDYRSSIGRHFAHLLNPRGVNLYVFQVQGNFSHDDASTPLKLHSNEVSLEMVLSRTLTRESLGWQKLDVTSVVQKWYGKQSRHRIRHASHHSYHQRFSLHNSSSNNNSNNNNNGGEKNGTKSRDHYSLRDKLILLVDCSGCGSSIHPIIFGRENNHNNAVMLSPDTDIPSHRTSSSHQLYNHHHHHNNRKDSHDSQDGHSDDSKYHHASTEESEYSQVVTKPHIDNFTEIPFLVLETESGPNFKRSRRRAMDCSPRVKHCCKQRFYVDFHELGWDDWIIAPRGYHANYCRGHCGGLHRTPDTFLNYHTHVIEEYRRSSGGQSNLTGITPCCAPTKFSSMSLIYFGPDLNIIKRDLPKMIVEECGCP